MRDIPQTLHIIEQGLRDGLHIGAQLVVILNGQVAVDLALGAARLPELGAGQVPMATDTLMLWLSAGKPITAAAILLLWERSLLALDEPVATYIPGFAAEGKHVITIRHLLTHTAGIRGVDASYPFQTWDETLARIYTLKMEKAWTPGLRAGYHTHTSWYLLGELIRRLTGTPCDVWIRENILLPAGMTDTWLAMDPTQYHAYANRIGYLYDTTVTPPTPPSPLKNYDTPLAASRPRPSASCRGPLRDLARFYELLRLHGTINNTAILHPDTVAAMTLRQRVGMFDQTFRQTIDWGLGLILNSSHYGPGIPYQFGPHASPDTFGHGGSQSSTGFCDPLHKLCVALLFNGCPGEAPHDKRLRATLKALYEDLSLA